MNLKKYYIVWKKTAILTWQKILMEKWASVLFILGKFVRFGFFIITLFVVIGRTREIAGYNLHHLINFFLIFNLMDLLGQLFFRGIYWFRWKVVTGHFDLDLVRPISPLFQSLTRRTDFLDFPLLFVIILALIKQNSGISLAHLGLFFLILIAGFLVITAIHVLVVSIGVMTTEVDHTIWIYRDLSLLARVPIDIYVDWLRAFLTFVLPVAVIFTFPAKALMGLLSWQGVVYSLLCSLFCVLASLKFWRFALTKYSSASS